MSFNINIEGDSKNNTFLDTKYLKQVLNKLENMRYNDDKEAVKRGYDIAIDDAVFVVEKAIEEIEKLRKDD